MTMRIPARKAIVLGLAIMSSAAAGECDFIIRLIGARREQLTCGVIKLTVHSERCTFVQNPCDAGWLPSNGFATDFDGMPPFHLTRTELASGEVQWAMCGAPVSNGQEWAGLYHYMRDRFAVSAYGTNYISVDVEPTPIPLGVEVFATPSQIVRGESSRLNAQPTNGIPPFAFTWTPATGLSDPTVASPLATPEQTTEYRATVTDSSGQTAAGSVTVTVQDYRAPTVSLTFVRGAFDPTLHTTHWTFTASAEPGPIISYRWDLLGNDGTRTSRISPDPVLEIDLPETVQRGTVTLTVTTATAIVTVHDNFR